VYFGLVRVKESMRVIVWGSVKKPSSRVLGGSVKMPISMGNVVKRVRVALGDRRTDGVNSMRRSWVICFGWVTGSMGLMRRFEGDEMVFVISSGFRWYIYNSFSL